MSELIKNTEYKNWLKDLKTKIQSSQIKAALAVNTQLILLYWDLGKQIVEKQENAKWGSGLIEQLSKDLKEEFPYVAGFSRSNLFAMRKFYLFYNQVNIIVQQPAGQLSEEEIQQAAGQIKFPIDLLSKIPWQHNIIIIEKIKIQSEAYFYVQQTIENNWSRSILQIQIESNLYGRQGKAINNFIHTLPKPQSDLANQLLKDPYNFDFLSLSKDVQELELEKKLVQNITQFLLELGKGFAYLGRQYLLNVGGKEFRTDLLFYHTRLKCYIIIELKTQEFQPEFVGKLNFYISAINGLVKTEEDKPTIGILLCKNKNNIVVDYALKDVNKPIGVSEFTFNQLPQEMQQALPSQTELENEILKSLENEQ